MSDLVSPDGTTTGKAKAAAFGAVGNFLAIVAVALQDGAVSNEDVATMASAGVIGAFTVYGVWKTRNYIRRSTT